MTRTLRVDFFKVSGPIAFEVALKKIWALPDEDARNYAYPDGPVRLRILSSSGGFIYGDMIRIRLGEPAFLAKLHGGIRPVTQDEDEGLGETNAFMYHIDTGYLAYQRNRTAVSASRTAYYVEQKSNVNEAFEFDPILSPVTVNKLLGKAPPKRLRMRVVASAIDPASAQNESLSDVIEAAHQMESAEVQVIFSMGHRKNGMKKDKVVQFIKSALRLKNEGHQVSALEVSAPDEAGGKSELLNFIDSTLMSSFPIEPSPLVEEFYKRRIGCLKAAWDEHHAILRT